MAYTLDHDLHIHSYLSTCSRDPGQTPARLLRYARECGLSDICVTDHFWDEDVPGASAWYHEQNAKHLALNLPLPQEAGIRFHYGCETELDKNNTLGLSREKMDAFEWILIPTTHLHMTGFTIREGVDTVEERVRLWSERFECVLNMDLPFHKVGIAHLTCQLMMKKPDGAFLRVINTIPDAEYGRLFSLAADRGVGIELNIPTYKYDDDELEQIMRPYRIARECGCKFFYGSDCHHPDRLNETPERFRKIMQFFPLEEDDIFRPFGN